LPNGREVRFGSWLRENSEIEFANGNFVSTSINLKNKSAGDGCRDKTIEKTILRAFRARTFSRSLGQNRKYSLRADDVRSTPESGLKSDIRPCPKSANNGSGSTRRKRTCSKSRSRIVRDVLRKMFRVFADAVQK
jgi:hypothetical protein